MPWTPRTRALIQSWPHKPKYNHLEPLGASLTARQPILLGIIAYFVIFNGFTLSKEATLSFIGTCEFIEAAPFWSPEVFCLGRRSCWAFHKVIYSRLQPFTASPLEMTLWNPSFPSPAMPWAAANSACLKTDEVFLLQFFWVGILKNASVIIIGSNYPPRPMIIKTLIDCPKSPSKVVLPKYLIPDWSQDQKMSIWAMVKVSMKGMLYRRRQCQIWLLWQGKKCGNMR